jgi:hypothetical protein
MPRFLVLLPPRLRGGLGSEKELRVESSRPTIFYFVFVGVARIVSTHPTKLKLSGTELATGLGYQNCAELGYRVTSFIPIAEKLKRYINS